MPKPPSVPPAPTRLSYSLVAVPPPKGSASYTSLRISVVYASGRTMYLPGRFTDSIAAEDYLARFYPDLLGKQTQK